MAQVIGFIGLGIMGRPMARNLLKAGYPSSCTAGVEDRSTRSLAAGAKVGSSHATSPRSRTSSSRCCPTRRTSSWWRSAVTASSRARAPVSSFVDMSTISPIVTKKVGEALAAKSVKMLDAPVSGGEKGAVDGALSIMVGGDKAVFDAVLPIFQAMGKTITHLGPLGFGGFTKLANQIIVAVNLTALAEALTLAKKAGLDRELTLTALAGGLAGSRCLDQKKPNYLADTYNPGLQDRPALQGPRAHHGVGARPRRAAARDRGGPGAVQRPRA